MLAIRLDNPPNSSRWYPGGGIYRNVWLTKTAPIHMSQWGPYITTPEVSAGAATMSSYDLYYPPWATSPDHEFFGQDHSPAVGRRICLDRF